jgi:four helix bundle protein
MMAHERLKCWELGHQLAVKVYRMTLGWPPEERYGLTSQIRRAAAAVPTTLAEGAAKRGPRELRRYVDISLASVSECGYLLYLARDLGLLTPDDYAHLDSLRKQTGGLIWRLARALDQRRP